MQSMGRLHIEDQGEIFRNPLPGHRVINSIFPDGGVLDTGEILVLVRVCLAMYSRDGELEIFRSTDGGGTWMRQGPILDTGADRVPYNYRIGCITQLRDGTLVLKMNRVPHEDANILLFSAETRGVLEGETSYLRSTDAGHSWSEPCPIELDEPFEARHVYEASGSMIELGDGTWFQAFETWKHHDDPELYDLNTYGMFSRDKGRTWRDRIPLAVGRDEGRSYSHGMPARWPLRFEGCAAGPARPTHHGKKLPRYLKIPPGFDYI